MAIKTLLGASGTPAFFEKTFTAEQGIALSAEIAGCLHLAGRRVVIIDHAPTAGLLPLIVGLREAGAEVIVRDHHADTDRDGVTIAAVRELLGSSATVVTRAEAPACAQLVGLGEFVGDVIVADPDQDGVTAALKAVGVSYPGMDEDAAVLDGPHAGKTEAALTVLGFRLVRAWGAIPAFGTPNRDRVFIDVVTAFAEAAGGSEEAERKLDVLAEEYERKVAAAKAIAATAVFLAPGVRFVDVTNAGGFDLTAFAAAMDLGALVTVTRKGDGPISRFHGGQISLCVTAAGKAKGISLLAVAVGVFGPRPENGWKPEDGIIGNIPGLLHLSPGKWEELQPFLLAGIGA